MRELFVTANKSRQSLEVQQEITALLKEKGFTCVSLGNRILRAETAGLYMLSVIDAWGD